MSGKYTEEELSGLSETERAALLADDPADDDATLADIAGEDDGEDTDGDEDNPDDVPGDDSEPNDDEPAADDEPAPVGDDPAADPAAADPAPAAVADDFDVSSVPEVAFLPKLSGELLPEFSAVADDLKAKLEDGEISVPEYMQEVRKLEAASQNEELQAQKWEAEQIAFFKANAGYSANANPVLFGTLNQEVMRVANDPANSGLSGSQVLYLAKHNVEKAFRAMFPGAALPGATATQTPAASKGNDKPAIPPKPKAKLPGDEHQTLRNVPAADAADVGTDKFAHLDKLSGDKLEAAIARMTPEEQDEYLRGA